MKNPLLLSVTALCFSLLSSGALALATDVEKPIEIEADFAELDDKAGRTTYTGNVVVVQGTMRMTGDKLIANFDEDRQLVDVFLSGKPAYFKQTPDGGKPEIEGQGLQIEYNQKKSLLYLIDKASLKQGDRLFEGYRINYDTKSSIITGRGSDSAGASSNKARTSRERVKVIIPPKRKTGE
jgi:lipopolysaccharide export system protein LptA